jgi:hypothetical protein
MTKNRADPGVQQGAAVPMEHPLKKEGDKIGVGIKKAGDKLSSGDQKEDHRSGGAGDPQVTPLEPEKQGGIGGP